MKIRIALLTASFVSLLGTGVAHADSTVISNTGPDSSNQVVVTNTHTHVVNNFNSSVVTNTNLQTGTSGTAQVNDNTSAGGATSGNVTNTNSFATAIAIGNGAAVIWPPAVDQPSNIAGGSGGGVASTSTGVSALELPKTGGNGIDMSLYNALANAPKGYISPLVRAGAAFDAKLLILAAVLAIGTGAVYSKFQKQSSLEIA